MGLAHEMPVLQEGKQHHSRLKEDVLVLRNRDPGIPMHRMVPCRGGGKGKGGMTAEVEDNRRTCAVYNLIYIAQNGQTGACSSGMQRTKAADRSTNCAFWQPEWKAAVSLDSSMMPHTRTWKSP